MQDQRAVSLASSTIDVNSSFHSSRPKNSILSGGGADSSYRADSLDVQSVSDSGSMLEMANRQSTEVGFDNDKKAKKYYAEAYDIVSRLL